ncbi:hypothetical protein BKA70DRAFT_1440815 [Coprinopsis sp. MPI-PUGE-AT-0042]|nr:hypothetical protein BKA70DRAFT_1440815 [Coprinopsis sp. MPI-PUGE-AT-0042]
MAQPSKFLSLPSELHLRIFCACAQTFSSEDIVALRQTCKSLHELENRHHASIWKVCTDRLIEEAALFPPTFTWRPSPPKLREQLARRAAYFKKILNEYQETTPTTPIPKHTLEFTIGSGFTDLALVPGGRFLLAMGNPTIGIFDLAPYFATGQNPSCIASFVCSDMEDQETVHRVVTFLGEKADRIRLMLAYRALRVRGYAPDNSLDSDTEEEDTDELFLIEVHEFSFVDDKVGHERLGTLPLQYLDSVECDLYALSGDCVGATLDARKALIWNYVDGTYTVFPLEQPSNEAPSELLFTSDRFIVFCPEFSERDETGSIGYRAGDMVSYDVPPLKPLDLAKRRYLRVSHFQDTALSITPFRTRLPLGSRGLKGLSPHRHSKSSWGQSEGRYTRSPYPLRDYLTKHMPPFVEEWAKNHSTPEGVLETYWITLDLDDSQHATGTAALLAVAHITETLPFPDDYWCTFGFDRRSSDGNIVSISQWEQHDPERSVPYFGDVMHFICASIGSTPSGKVPASNRSEGTTLHSKRQLVPLDMYGERLGPACFKKAWDLCPLSGTAVALVGDSSTIRLHDYVLPYMRRK